MAYVMVPVPDELVPEVKQFLRWNVAGPLLGELDDAAAARFFATLDDAARRFLLVGADAALEARGLPGAAAAPPPGCSERETLGLMAELNTSVQYFGTLPLGLVSRDQGEVAEGHEGEPPYTYTMRADVAAIVLNASGHGVAAH